MNLPIYSRNIPFPMEILDHSGIIELICKYYKPRLFVELGAGDGSCIERYSKHCGVVYGVDLKRRLKSGVEEIKNLCFYEGSCNDFFKNENIEGIIGEHGMIEMCFIDADHAFESVKNDFLNVWKWLRRGGIIFIHDTFPCNEFCLSPVFCNDSYKIGMWLKGREDYLKGRMEVLTIPIQPGLTMVRKCWVEECKGDSKEEWGIKIDSGL